MHPVPAAKGGKKKKGANPWSDDEDDDGGALDLGDDSEEDFKVWEGRRQRAKHLSAATGAPSSLSGCPAARPHGRPLITQP